MPQIKSLSTRIVAMAMFSFVLIIALNYLLVSRSYNTDAIAAMEEKAGAFTAVADAAKSNQSDLLTRGGVDTSALLSEAQEQLKQGGRYQDTRFFNTIPVVVGWNAAAKAAEREGIEFQVVAFDARNEQNSPRPGGFREQLLRDLEKQIGSGGDLSMSRINPETNKLHYMRGIELDTSCMICHGEPGGRFDEDKDGLDPLGFPMEGWDPTQTHGAYEVVSSMDIVDERVSSFIWSGITWSVPLLALVGFVFFAFLRSSFGKPMKVLVDRLRDIAEGDGDLSVRLNEESQNEIGLVGKWFNQFLGKLEGVVGEVLVGMKQIDSGAEQVSKTSQDLAKGSTNQARELQQIESMIDETSQSTQRSAQNAGVASDHSSEASELAKTGQEGVHEMNTAMEGIRQSSQEMAGVIKAIDDIAFQTNLLALNAAVEAARAGDAGQGFAVVAEEVRSLAQHSAEAARKTATMIADSMAKVEETSAISSRVAEALDKIVDGTGQVDQLLTSIAEDSNQQAGSIEQLTSTIRAIADVTQAGAGNSEELAAASEETASMVATLQGTIGVFRVREELLKKSQQSQGYEAR